MTYDVKKIELLAIMTKEPLIGSLTDELGADAIVMRAQLTGDAAKKALDSMLAIMTKGVDGKFGPEPVFMVAVQDHQEYAVFEVSREKLYATEAAYASDTIFHFVDGEDRGAPPESKVHAVIAERRRRSH